MAFEPQSDHFEDSSPVDPRVFGRRDGGLCPEDNVHTAQPIAGLVRTTDGAHEFRTPLNAVIGLSEVLLADTSEPLTPRQSQAVAQVRAAGLRLLDLVETEMDSLEPDAAPETAHVALPEAIDPGRVLHRVHDILRGRLEAQDVTLMEPLILTETFAAADRTLLRRIFYAQTAHVLAGCRPGAEIATELRRGRDFVEIAVAARQPCAPRRAAGAALFSENGNRTVPSLRGIGLSGARRLALAMGGRIEHGRLTAGAYDGYDPGLILMLTPAGRPPESRRTLSNRRARPIVLYVEDHPTNVLLMRRVLEALGDFDLYVGETGPRGLAMAGDLVPDVVLLDLNLPGLDGFQVKAGLDRNAATRDIPVIAVTANATAQDLRKGRDAGFLDYVTKPIDIPALAAALRRALGSEAVAGRRAA